MEGGEVNGCDCHSSPQLTINHKDTVPPHLFVHNALVKCVGHHVVAGLKRQHELDTSPGQWKQGKGFYPLPVIISLGGSARQVLHVTLTS